jgi:hypothetical protein
MDGDEYSSTRGRREERSAMRILPRWGGARLSTPPRTNIHYSANTSPLSLECVCTVVALLNRGVGLHCVSVNVQSMEAHHDTTRENQTNIQIWQHCQAINETAIRSGKQCDKNPHIFIYPQEVSKGNSILKTCRCFKLLFEEKNLTRKQLANKLRKPCLSIFRIAIQFASFARKTLL